MSEDGEASQAHQPKYWLIVKHEISGVNVLAIDLPGGEKALAVFSFEEEAELFLHHELSGTGWWVREAMIGELVSVLYGLCASVAKVALDPLPRNVSGGTNGLLSLRHDAFARVLVGERGSPRMALGEACPWSSPVSPLSQGRKNDDGDEADRLPGRGPVSGWIVHQHREDRGDRRGRG